MLKRSSGEGLLSEIGFNSCQSRALTSLLHARYDSIKVTITRKYHESCVGLSCLNGGVWLDIAVVGDAFLVRGMGFGAGELLGYVGEGCRTAILLMGEAEDEVETDLRVLSVSGLRRPGDQGD